MKLAKLLAALALTNLATCWGTAAYYELDAIEHGVAARRYQADGSRRFQWAEVKTTGRWVE